MWVPLLVLKYSSAFPWSCFHWEIALHREASMSVPVKSLVCLMLALLWRCIFPTQAWVSNRQLRGKAGLQEQIQLSSSLFEGFGSRKESNLAVRCVSVLCSKVWCGGDQELVIGTELIPAFIVAALQTSKQKSYSLYTYKRNFQSWSRAIFACKFKRQAFLIWAGGHAV